MDGRDRDVSIVDESSSAPSGRGIFLRELLENLKTISEEQAWAICYLSACALKLCTKPIRREQVYLTKEGTIEIVELDKQDEDENVEDEEDEVVSSLGMLIFETLDYGIGEDEERELSDPLNELLAHLCGDAEEDDCSSAGSIQRGNSGDSDERFVWPAGSLSASTVVRVCEFHATCVDSQARQHYVTICKGLVEEGLLVAGAAVLEGKKSDLDFLEEKPSTLVSLWKSVASEVMGGISLRKLSQKPNKKVSLTIHEVLLLELQNRKTELNHVEVQPYINPHIDMMSQIREGPSLKPAAERVLATRDVKKSRHEMLLDQLSSPARLKQLKEEEKNYRDIPQIDLTTAANFSRRLCYSQEPDMGMETIDYETDHRHSRAKGVFKRSSTMGAARRHAFTARMRRSFKKRQEVLGSSHSKLSASSSVNNLSASSNQLQVNLAKNGGPLLSPFQRTASVQEKTLKSFNGFTLSTFHPPLSSHSATSLPTSSSLSENNFLNEGIMLEGEDCTEQGRPLTSSVDVFFPEHEDLSFGKPSPVNSPHIRHRSRTVDSYDLLPGFRDQETEAVFATHLFPNQAQHEKQQLSTKSEKANRSSEENLRIDLRNRPTTLNFHDSRQCSPGRENTSGSDLGSENHQRSPVTNGERRLTDNEKKQLKNSSTGEQYKMKALSFVGRSLSRKRLNASGIQVKVTSDSDVHSLPLSNGPFLSNDCSAKDINNPLRSRLNELPSPPLSSSSHKHQSSMVGWFRLKEGIASKQVTRSASPDMNLEVGNGWTAVDKSSRQSKASPTRSGSVRRLPTLEINTGSRLRSSEAREGKVGTSLGNTNSAKGNRLALGVQDSSDAFEKRAFRQTQSSSIDTGPSPQTIPGSTPLSNSQPKPARINEKVPVINADISYEELTHVQKVLAQIDEDTYSHNSDLYNKLKAGKLCFVCKVKRFNFLRIGARKCPLCARWVCQGCMSKVPLPSVNVLDQVDQVCLNEPGAVSTYMIEVCNSCRTRLLTLNEDETTVRRASQKQTNQSDLRSSRQHARVLPPGKSQHS